MYIKRIPDALAEEMFDIESQKEISNLKCKKLNMDQQFRMKGTCNNNFSSILQGDMGKPF